MRHVFENAGLKILSVLLAVVVWFVVAGEKTSERGLTVPVELRNLPEDLEVVGDAVNAVEVRLRATPAIVRQIERQDVSVRVDLKGFKEGEHFFHLTESAVRRPFGVTIVKLSPASLTLHIERTETRELPISARVVGTPAPAFEVAEVKTRPETVRVSGPRTRVGALRSASTEAVSVEGAQSSVTSTVTIGIGDPLVRLQGDPRVEVTAVVRARQDVREVKDLEVQVRGGRAQVKPARVSVVVTGPQSVLDQLHDDAVRPYVDVGRAHSSGSVPVATELAPGTAGVTVESVQPATVVLVMDGER